MFLSQSLMLCEATTCPALVHDGCNQSSPVSRSHCCIHNISDLQAIKHKKLLNVSLTVAML